jgi:hypothetical protein
MASEKGKKIGAIIIMAGIFISLIGLATDSKGLFAFIGVILLLVGRIVNEYF